MLPVAVYATRTRQSEQPKTFREAASDKAPILAFPARPAESATHVHFDDNKKKKCDDSKIRNHERIYLRNSGTTCSCLFSRTTCDISDALSAEEPADCGANNNASERQESPTSVPIGLIHTIEGSYDRDLQLRYLWG